MSHLRVPKVPTVFGSSLAASESFSASTSACSFLELRTCSNVFYLNTISLSWLWIYANVSHFLEAHFSWNHSWLSSTSDASCTFILEPNFLPSHDVREGPRMHMTPASDQDVTCCAQNGAGYRPPWHPLWQLDTRQKQEVSDDNRGRFKASTWTPDQTRLETLCKASKPEAPPLSTDYAWHAQLALFGVLRKPLITQVCVVV